MNRAQFVEQYGQRYSHCENLEPHAAHSWEYQPEDPAAKQNPWWCSGQPVAQDEIDVVQLGEVGHGETSAVHLGIPTATTRPDSKESLDDHLRKAGLPVTGDEAVTILRQKLQDRPIENRSLPVRWADRAMFQAEPIEASDGPKVYLLWMTPDPLGAIAAACKMYKGEVVRDLSTVTDDERIEYFRQVQKTKLKAPFEFVKFHFLIEGVTRAFTHQMVRQRTAVYAQESLRFAVLGDESREIPVSLPPSLSGTDGDDGRLQVIAGNEDRLNDADRMRLIWDEAVHSAGASYSKLIELGMPAEDARGLLPHSTLTRLHYSTDLRALLDHAGNRLCTQAQFEWRLVFARLIEAIREAGSETSGYRSDFGGELIQDGSNYVYFADTLADLFKPVCYQTGRCEFKANFDRACSIRSRVDANEAIGRPSSLWELEHDEVPADTIVSGVGPQSVVRNEYGTPVFIGAIKPGEWLLDPGAARQQ